MVSEVESAHLVHHLPHMVISSKTTTSLHQKSLTTTAGQVYTPKGGGGHCLFEGRYPKQNYRPPVLCHHSPLSLSLLVYSPLFLRHQRKAYYYYCCYCGLPPVDIILSCPDTITFITVAKTLIQDAFLGVAKLTTTAPTGNAPLTTPLLRVLGSVTVSPPFSGLQPQLRESVLQWVPKTRGSAPPPGIHTTHLQEMARGRRG